MFKFAENSPELEKYLFSFGVNEHPLQKEIREYTEKNLGNSAIMQISPDQGALLQFIIKSSNIQNCLEIGTFTGYSAMTMALALPENLEKDGIIIIDNTLWKGKIIDPNISDDQTISIREFNRFVKDFKGTESMILPIADGMTICRKL